MIDKLNKIANLGKLHTDLIRDLRNDLRDVWEQYVELGLAGSCDRFPSRITRIYNYSDHTHIVGFDDAGIPCDCSLGYDFINLDAGGRVQYAVDRFEHGV